jgi:hypothetical protein
VGVDVVGVVDSWVVGLLIYIPVEYLRKAAQLLRCVVGCGEAEKDQKKRFSECERVGGWVSEVGEVRALFSALSSRFLSLLSVCSLGCSVAVAGSHGSICLVIPP